MLADPHLRGGLNVHQGKLIHPAVAEAQGKPFSDAREVLES